MVCEFFSLCVFAFNLPRCVSPRVALFARTMKICSNQCVCGVRVWVILILESPSLLGLALIAAACAVVVAPFVIDPIDCTSFALFAALRRIHVHRF